MGNYVKRIRSWFALRHIGHARQGALQWEAEARRLANLLDQRQGQLRSLKRLFTNVYEEAVEEIDQAKGLIDKYEPTMEGLRNKVEVLEDILVPELTAAHKLVLERTDADIAVQIRRRVGNETRE